MLKAMVAIVALLITVYAWGFLGALTIGLQVSAQAAAAHAERMQ